MNNIEAHIKSVNEKLQQLVKKHIAQCPGNYKIHRALIIKIDNN